jgi:hypothetical protein
MKHKPNLVSYGLSLLTATAALIGATGPLQLKAGCGVRSAAWRDHQASAFDEAVPLNGRLRSKIPVPLRRRGPRRNQKHGLPNLLKK